jgi:hypothetical protein
MPIRAMREDDTVALSDLIGSAADITRGEAGEYDRWNRRHSFVSSHCGEDLLE